MPLFDLSLPELQTYQPVRNEPADFDAFWHETLNLTRRYPLEARFEAVETGLITLEAFDVTFNGYGGQPIKAWLMLPRQRTEPLPCVLSFIGYGAGRGLPTDSLFFASLGYANLVMDTRGQGSWGRSGDTPDLESDGGNPQYPGFMTRGILKPETYFYRRVFADAVRAIETARAHPSVDASRIAVSGSSQGGGIAIAAAALESSVTALIADMPFLCHYRRATQIVDTAPYNELNRYFAVHRDKIETAFSTLEYFDGVNFASRVRAETLFSVGLMDMICPPSTVYAAYNQIAAKKQICVYPYNGHEGGQEFQARETVRFLKQHFGQ